MPTSPDIPLWLLIGLPGSGKSTWARNFQQMNAPIALIATDHIRRELFGDEATQGPWFQVWAAVRDRLRQAAQKTQAGQLRGAIYDATNAQRRSRRQVIQQAQAAGFTRLLAVWVDVPLATCLARNQQRSRQVPPAVIHTMARQLDGAPPDWDEGFDAMYRLLPCPSPSPNPVRVEDASQQRP